MSATIACSDFLHTSGQCPASLRMPPACPPMPKAHVLQAFFARIAFHSCHQPTRWAMRNVYRIAAQPPPLFIRFMTAPVVLLRADDLYSDWARGIGEVSAAGAVIGRSAFSAMSRR